MRILWVSSVFPCFSCAFVVLAGLRVVYLNSFSSIIYWLWPGVTLCPPRLYYYLPGVECLHFGKTSHPADIILLFCLESCAWSRSLSPKLILFIYFRIFHIIYFGPMWSHPFIITNSTLVIIKNIIPAGGQKYDP